MEALIKNEWEHACPNNLPESSSKTIVIVADFGSVFNWNTGVLFSSAFCASYNRNNNNLVRSVFKTEKYSNNELKDSYLQISICFWQTFRTDFEYFCRLGLCIGSQMEICNSMGRCNHQILRICATVDAANFRPLFRSDSISLHWRCGRRHYRVLMFTNILK